MTYAVKHLKTEVLRKNAEVREAHLTSLFDDLVKDGWEILSVAPTELGWLCAVRR